MIPSLPIRTACLGLWVLLLSPGFAAPPKLNYLLPTGAQRSETSTITAHGSWSEWPVTVWVDRPGVEFTATPEKGKLQAAVAANAEAGIYWMRLVSRDGASSAKPFFVGTLPEAIEIEPNDDPLQPQRLEKNSTVVSGRYDKRDDVDTFTLELRQGEVLVVAVQANRDLQSDVDPVVQICSSDRFVLEQNDDARGIDPAITFTVPADGLYLVRTFGFPATPTSTIGFAGNENYLYRLTMTTGPFLDYTLPLAIARGASTEVELHGWNLSDQARQIPLVASDDGEWVTAGHPALANSLPLPVVNHPSVVAKADCSRKSPQPLTIPQSISGIIESPQDEDAFLVSRKKGETMEIEVKSDQLGFLLDPVVSVIDSNGRVLAEADDSNKARDPILKFTAPADGDYLLAIQDVHGHGGFRYVYQLNVRELKPDFALKVDADTFTLPAGGKLEIAVSVERLQGFNQEVEITAVGLPPGLTAETVRSAPQGESEKKVKLLVQAGADGQSGAFQIVGKTTGDSPFQRRAQFIDNAPSMLSPGWITVMPPK